MSTLLIPKLTEKTENKLLECADKLKRGETNVYKAWVQSGLPNDHFQLHFNKWASSEFGGFVGSSEVKGMAEDFANLAAVVVQKSRAMVRK